MKYATWTFLISIIVCNPLCLIAAESDAAVLTTIRSIHEFQRRKSDTAQPIDLEAILTSKSGSGKFLRVQDDFGCTLVCPTAKELDEQLKELDFGDRVRMRGHIPPNQGVFQITELSVLEKSVEIQPLPFDKNSGSISANLGKYFSASGVVQEILEHGNNVDMVVSTVNGQVRARIVAVNSGDPISSWLGQKIDVNGVLVRIHLNNGLTAGQRLMLMDERQLKLHGPVENFPLEMVDPKHENASEISGVVEAFDATRFLIVDGKFVRTMNSSILRLGQKVTGFSYNETKKRNESFIYLKLQGNGEVSAPTLFPASEVVAKAQLFSRVTVTGNVIKWQKKNYWWECDVQSGQTKFRINIQSNESESDKQTLEKHPIGSLVSFTGVYTEASKTDLDFNAFCIRTVITDDIKLIRTESLIRQDQIFAWIGAGSIVSLITVVWVVSLRRQVATRTSEAVRIATRMKASTEAMVDGLFIFGSDQCLIDWNKNAAQLACKNLTEGMTESSVWEALAENSIHSIELESLRQLAASQWTHAGSVDFSTQRLPGNSSLSWYSVSTAPIFDKTYGYSGRIWTFRDLSLFHSIQEERASMEKYVAIGQLAGGIAHDFNNLLAAMASNLTLAQLQPTISEPKRNHIEIAQSAIQRAARLTKHLLDYSRQSPIERKVIHPAELISDVEGLMRHSLDSTIQFTCTTQNDLDCCLGDSSQLEHVFLNLCINAKDALKDKYGSIHLRAMNTIHPTLGACVRFTVEDDGIGIEPNVISRIFEPFFTTKPVGSGTGLGLSIVVGIVEQHRGKIECHSTYGEGTQFNVYLPRADSTSQRLPVPSPKIHVQEPSLGSQRILLVDDDPLLRESGSLLLSVIGHQVECAEHGRAALHKLEVDSAFDLVLLDLTMPVMSGRETLEAIKRKYPWIRVVLCSGYSVEQNLMDSDASLRADGMLAKPFQLAELEAAVSRKATLHIEDVGSHAEKGSVSVQARAETGLADSRKAS